MSEIPTRRRGMVKALALLLLAVTVASPAAGAKETWDHVANIKDAATRLAALHNREGSTGVLKFLDACYRTQMLASEFSQGLESCMAQDYMHSQVLAQIYARIPQAERVRMGTPAPEDIARGMGERFVAAFSQYKMTVKEADNFKKLVDKNGMPIFIKGIFPKKKPGDADSAGNGDDAGKTDKK